MSHIEDQLTGLIDDRAFQDLDERFGRFNIFESVGAVRGELRHSNFLAFLLSPHGSHGLSSEPLQRILRGFITKSPRESRPIGSLKVAVGDLDGALVFRERDNLDLLIEIGELNLVVVVENKVDAKAGDGQLARYRALIDAKYPGWRKLLVFLTPDGIDAAEDGWLAYSYIDLARIIESLATERASSLPSEVALVLRHYVEMLRRHIVPDEELKELALQIYQRHREALDFIFAECRPDIGGGLLSVVRPLLDEQTDLIPDKHTALMLRFAPAKWTQVPALNACPKDLWTKTGRNAIFEVKSFKTEANNFSDRILLSLILGPSDAALRQRLFEAVRAQPNVFAGAGKVIGQSWVTIYARELLNAVAAKSMDDDEKASTIASAWKDFVRTDLPRLTEAMDRIGANEAMP